MSEKIKIVKIGRKQQPSKFKPGETYNITTLMDEQNRKLVAMGRWADNWKIGDVIEANIEEKKWTDKDGFEQISLNLKNPEQKPFTPFGGGQKTNPIVIAYQLAASLAPLFFGDKKKITLADVDKLAEELKKRIDVPTTTEEVKKEEKVPEINVDTNQVEEDDKPF